MLRDETLEKYLAEQGIAWETILADRHYALERQWHATYGRVWQDDLPHKHGIRAQDAYSRHSADVFLIVPILGNTAGPHGIGTPGPRTAAYECRGDGTLPDLSAFQNLDFFIAPPDLSWTMLHTHEDHVLGGPYFIELARLIPTTRRA